MMTPTAPVLVDPARRLFTVVEYDQMVAASVLRADERLELVGGEIVQMAPIGIRHAACVRRLNKLLVRQAGDAVIVDIQSPIRLGNDSQPQPDVVLLRPPAGAYDHALPTSNDILLLVEVSDTTLAYDRQVKLPLYAQAGIPEVWIVNLVQDTVEVYAEPADGIYATARLLGRDEALSPTGLPDVSVAVGEILV